MRQTRQGNSRASLPEDIQFADNHWNAGFILGVPGFLDALAKRARMFSVERLGNRFAEPGGPAVVDNHRSPRDRLEDDPVPARCGQKRNEHENLAKSVQGGGQGVILSERAEYCQRAPLRCG